MIYVFGSCNVDMVFRLKTHPHPGETVLCPEYTLYAGGKGANQAVAAARAGSEVAMVGCLGEDDMAHFLLTSLQESGVNTRWIKRAPLPVRTGCAVINVDEQGENCIVVASGANFALRCDDLPWTSLHKDDVIVLQMETKASENWRLIHQAHERGYRIILNVAPMSVVPREILTYIDVLIVNEHEIHAFDAWMPKHLASEQEQAQWLAHTFGLTVIVTLGEKGVVVADPTEGFSQRSYPVTVVDTTCAGDTFVGYFASAYEKGRPLHECVNLGVGAGALACTHKGAQVSIPSAEDVEIFIGLDWS